MKNKILRIGVIGIMLVFGAVIVNAQHFSRSFNMDYPVYGIDLMGYSKSPTVRDLTIPENFVSGGDRRVTCEGASFNKDGDEYTIKLLLNTGLRRNCVTALSFYDFSTRKNELISYSGRERMLERLITRYVEFMDMFYNKNTLLS